MKRPATGLSLERTLILGSTSPYRRDLLARLGLAFEIVAPQVDESPLPMERSDVLACRLARMKALAVAQKYPSAVVIGSDQVADLDGQVLGKPGSRANAISQLTMMNGKVVTFHTAVAVACIDLGHLESDIASVVVRFRTLLQAEIETYVDREQPYDCAGSAKSEGLGIALVDAIESDDPTALIGLPLIRTCRLLRASGIRVL